MNFKQNTQQYSRQRCKNYRLKPRPHQQQCWSNIVECYESNDSFDKVECCFGIVVFLATMLPFWQQC